MQIDFRSTIFNNNIFYKIDFIPKFIEKVSFSARFYNNNYMLISDILNPNHQKLYYNLGQCVSKTLNFSRSLRSPFSELIK